MRLVLQGFPSVFLVPCAARQVAPDEQPAASLLPGPPPACRATWILPASSCAPLAPTGTEGVLQGQWQGDESGICALIQREGDSSPWWSFAPEGPGFRGSMACVTDTCRSSAWLVVDQSEPGDEVYGEFLGVPILEPSDEFVAKVTATACPDGPWPGRSQDEWWPAVR